jgi:hypothetical protein
LTCGAPTCEYLPSNEFGPDYSPDGSKIVFTSTRRQDKIENAVMNSDGSNQTLLGGSGQDDLGPVYSPAGDRIAFWGGSWWGGVGEIHVAGNNGSGATKITNLTEVGHPAWAVFTADDGGPQEKRAEPEPVLGGSAELRRTSGTVTTQCDGNRFRKLTRPTLVEVGDDADQVCTVDATKGTVEVIAATDTSGGVQRARFSQGVFDVHQRESDAPNTLLVLAGSRNCSKAKRSSKGKRTPRGRRLWGRGSGQFTIRGRRGAATARDDAHWQVEDRCDDATGVRVKKGSVDFRDLVKNRTVVVTAGQTYVAKR